MKTEHKELIDQLRNEESSEEVKTLVKTLRQGPNPSITIAGIVNAILNEHRTHQQNIVRNLRDILACLSVGMQDCTDMRNEASFEFCKKVDEMDHHFPYV